MEFLVKLIALPPLVQTPDKFADLLAAERARGASLLAAGKIRRMWRMPGSATSLLLWDVASAEELHALLSSMPAWPYCQTEVTPLVTHPIELAKEAAL